jgi:anti-anti-sigma factor
VRAEGRLTDPAAVAGADHVCWVYEDEAAFGEVARYFLAEGLTRGERLLYVGRRSSVDLGALSAGGALRVLDVGEAYEADGRFTPEEQLAYYRAATDRALADGFGGLRVVAELSDLAADPRRRGDLLRWEHIADDFIGCGSGLVALCAYRADLAADALAEVASVHPLVHAPPGGPPFRIWSDGDRLVLAGALDVFGAGGLRRVLADTPLAGARAVLDMTRMDFVDVAGCRTLAQWAEELRRRAARLELVGCSRMFRRMWQLLGFDDLVDVAFREAEA